MNQKTYSFQEVVKLLSEKYGVPFEIVESILVDWLIILHETMPESFDSEEKYINGSFLN
jgi:hypothetical protein